ncbi:hemerythrin domain-containing protein [Streptomyces sp. NRRL F-2664]|uniref:hemerythrin domain-containing protein n=1 Tax=Streptomyces sp. NRRL F-2664 TaxID=1463842 RepID=UPI00068E9F7A|nr:hemerythrin domain-containing protein [Streptomyces sp. NRRL F-2664]
MAHTADVITELTAHHREMDETFDIIERAVPAAERQTAAERLTVELVRHTVAAEEHLFPTVREVLPDGDLIADREIADHARMEKILRDLDGLDADGPDFDRLVAALRAEVTAHVWDEEENLFPRLRESLPQEALTRLGEDVRRTKTPPGTPRTGPGSGDRPRPPYPHHHWA